MNDEEEEEREIKRLHLELMRFELKYVEMCFWITVVGFVIAVILGPLTRADRAAAPAPDPKLELERTR